MSSQDAALGGHQQWQLPPRVTEQLALHEQWFRAAAQNDLASVDATPQRRVEKVAIVRVRRQQASLSEDERRTFQRAVAAMIEEGTYDRLARLPQEPSYNTSGSQGVMGLHRFLPWHRRFVWEFETELQRIEHRLRPNELPLALPYWNWSDPVPTWLTGFVEGDEALLRQAPASAPLKPTNDDLWLILHGFSHHLPIAQIGDYARFTYALEGWALRPNGTPLPGHNQVLYWLQSILGQTAGQRPHPIFWLHLAQVDRLWCLWQAKQRGCVPALAGSARLLDPWPQTADEMLNPASVGYAYDE